MYKKNGGRAVIAQADFSLGDCFFIRGFFSEGIRVMMHIISTRRKAECEYCGEVTRNMYPVFERHVRACCGEHAYRAHRQEVMIERILQSAAQRVRMCGQGLIEYSLILALVSVVVIIILSVLGPSVGNIFSSIVMSI